MVVVFSLLNKPAHELDLSVFPAISKSYHIAHRIFRANGFWILCETSRSSVDALCQVYTIRPQRYIDKA